MLIDWLFKRYTHQIPIRKEKKKKTAKHHFPFHLNCVRFHTWEKKLCCSSGWHREIHIKTVGKNCFSRRNDMTWAKP